MNSQELSRAEFEKWISGPPIERNLDRWLDHCLDPNSAWPGQYKDYSVQLAWEAWQKARESQPEHARFLESELDRRSRGESICVRCFLRKSPTKMEADF